MILRRFNLTVIVEECEDDVAAIHAADNVFHKQFKKQGVVRTSRRNHKDLRTVTFTFTNEHLIDQFMVTVQKEYVKIINKKH